jgi:hypothetical protein
MPTKQIYLTVKQEQQLAQLELAQETSASSIIRALISEKWARLVDMGLIKVGALPHPDGAQVVPVVTVCNHPYSRRVTSREPVGNMYFDTGGIVDNYRTVVTCGVCGETIE